MASETLYAESVDQWEAEWTDSANIIGQYDVATASFARDAITGSYSGDANFANTAVTPTSISSFLVRLWNSGVSRTDDVVKCEVYNNHTEAWEEIDELAADLPEGETEYDYTTEVQAKFAAAADKTAFINALAFRWYVTVVKAFDGIVLATQGVKCVVEYTPVVVYEEFNRIVSADIVITETDEAVLLDTGKTVVANAQVSCTDVMIMAEANRTVQATVVTSCTDAGRFWVSPISHNALGFWGNETFAYDENESTYAFDPGQESSWCGYLELTLPFTLVDCTRVKFKASRNGEAEINLAEIDVYYDSAWHNIYSGNDWIDAVYKECWLSTIQDVERIRFRAYNSGAAPHFIDLYEVYGWEGGVQYQELNLSVSGDGVMTETDNLIMVEADKTVSVDGIISESDLQEMVELGRAVSATSIVSCADTLIPVGVEIYEEFLRTVIADGVVSETDEAVLSEPNKTVQADVVVTESDLQEMVEAVSVEAGAVVSCLDDLLGTYQELERTVQTAAVVSCTDALIGIESNRIAQADAVVTEIEITILLETDRIVSATAAVTKTDEAILLELDRTVQATAVITEADITIMTEALSVQADAVISESDLQEMVEAVSVSADFTVSCLDSMAGLNVAAAFMILRQMTS